MAASEMAHTDIFDVDAVALKAEILLVGAVDDVEGETTTETAKVPDLSLTTSADDGDEDTGVDDVRSPPNTPCAAVPKRDTTMAVADASSPRGQDGPLGAAEDKDITNNEEPKSAADESERERSHSPFRPFLTNIQSLMNPSPQQLRSSATKVEDRKQEDSQLSNEKDITPAIERTDTDDNEKDNIKPTTKEVVEHDKTVEGKKAEEDKADIPKGSVPVVDTPLLPMKILPPDDILSPKQAAEKTIGPKGKESPSPSRFQSFMDNMLKSSTKSDTAVKQQEEGKDNHLVLLPWEVAEDNSPSINTDNASDCSQKNDKDKQQAARASTLAMPTLETKTEAQTPATPTNISNSKDETKPLLGGFLSQAKDLMNKRTASSISNASGSSLSVGKIDDEVSELEEEESEVDDDASAAVLGGFLGLMRSANNLPTRSKSNNKHDHNEQELAHSLEEHTYSKPTNCDICSGLLVGLWSQGLQCKLCGLNVHRGEGIGGHDDCRAEALLKGCPGEHHCQPCVSPGGTSKKEPVRMREVVEQMRQLAKDKPNFLQEVKAQMDRDFSSQIKGIIVSKSAEEQKSKSLLRARNTIVPFIEQVDGMEPRGTLYIYSFLFLGHVALAVSVGFIGWVGFILTVWPKYGLLTKPALNLAHIHNMTVAYSFHVSLALIVLFLRRLINLMNRKSTVLDHFLREVFKLEAEQDLGISVNGVAKRAQLWIRRVANSSCIMCLVALMLWYSSQPPPSLFQPFCIA